MQLPVSRRCVWRSSDVNQDSRTSEDLHRTVRPDKCLTPLYPTGQPSRRTCSYPLVDTSASAGAPDGSIDSILRGLIDARQGTRHTALAIWDEGVR
jgi:hypothetical protein